MRRALQDKGPAALTWIYQIYQPQVVRWVYAHSRFEQTNESADFFASKAFSDFDFGLCGEHYSPRRSPPGAWPNSWPNRTPRMTAS